jgi:transcriptional regulator with XRE-family HTH domain
MNVREVGTFIRNQRLGARLSLKKMSGLAGVSIPYLSQIERGLRRPSADILQAIAKGLRISAETLYVQAGILEERPPADVATAIMGDPTITERQKQALIQIYQAFQDESARITPPVPDRADERARRRSGSKKSAAKPRKEV